MATRSEVLADLSAADTWTDPMSAQRGSYQILITGTGTAELTLRWTPSEVTSTAAGGWTPVDPSDSATAWYTRATPHRQVRARHLHRRSPAGDLARVRASRHRTPVSL